MKKAVVILPTYNEVENIEKTISAVYSVVKPIKNWHVEILVVDDKSPDGTASVVRRLQKKYKTLHLILGNKQGLGKAYTRGFSYALEKLSPDVLFEMDADGQHPPAIIPSMLKKIDTGVDFVIGSRYMKGGAIPKNWGVMRKMYSVLGNLIVRLGFMHLAVRDWTNGFRAIRSWVAQEIVQEMGQYTGYVFQIALLDKAIKRNAVIAEVPFHFLERTRGESKIQTGEFITNCLLYIFNNSSFIKFVIVGLAGFVVDFGFAYFFIHAVDIAKPLANAASAELAIVSNFLFNNFWSFKHKKIKGSVLMYFTKFLFFNLVSSGSIAIQGFGIYLALSWFGDTMFRIGFAAIQSWIVYKVFIIAFIIIPYSYVLYNKIIWNKK